MKEKGATEINLLKSFSCCPDLIILNLCKIMINFLNSLVKIKTKSLKKLKNTHIFYWILIFNSLLTFAQDYSCFTVDSEEYPIALKAIGVNNIHPNGYTGLDLTGYNQNIIHIEGGGQCYPFPQPEFNDCNGNLRINNGINCPSTQPASHPRTVNYCLIGRYYNNVNKMGSAPLANSYSVSAGANIPDTDPDYFDAKVIISTNLSIAAEDCEDYYSATEQGMDLELFNNDEILYVASSGNNSNCPSPNNYFRLSTGATIAKNTLTVSTYSTSNIEKSFISKGGQGLNGPTLDGRLKPDVLGPCTSVPGASCASSFSAPYIAGGAALLQDQWANSLPTMQLPMSSTIKGLIIHSCQPCDTYTDLPLYEQDYIGPSYECGYGLPNYEDAAIVIKEYRDRLDTEMQPNIIEETLLEGGSDIQIQYPTNALSKNLKVTLVWTDVEGQPIIPGPNDVNGADIPPSVLINDLNLTIEQGGNIYHPWVLDPFNPSLPAITGIDTRNNVEQVYIHPSDFNAGQTYTINISKTGVLANSEQKFSIIISTDTEGYYLGCEEPIGTEDILVCEDNVSNIEVSINGGSTDAGWSYEWIDPNNILSSTTIPNPIISSLDSSTELVCIVTSPSGCTINKKVNLITCINEDICVENGEVYDIIDQNLKFGPGVGINVMPGGKLRILNSRLSSVGDEKWRGITVLGHGDPNDIPLSFSGDPSPTEVFSPDETHNQGAVVIAQSEISNAEIAIFAPEDFSEDFCGNTFDNTSGAIVLVFGKIKFSESESTYGPNPSSQLLINQDAGLNQHPTEIKEERNKFFNNTRDIVLENIAIGVSQVSGSEFYTTSEHPNIHIKGTNDFYCLINKFNGTEGDADNAILIEEGRNNLFWHNDFYNLDKGILSSGNTGVFENNDFNQCFIGLYYDGFDCIDDDGSVQSCDCMCGSVGDPLVIDNGDGSFETIDGESSEFLSNNFIDCSTGLLLLNGKNDLISGNIAFSTEPGVGVFTTGSSLLTIQGNHFDLVGSQSYGMILDFYQTDITHSNDIINNTFKNSDYGLYIDSPNENLEMNCNQFVGKKGSDELFEAHPEGAVACVNGKLGIMGGCTNSTDPIIQIGVPRGNQWNYPDAANDWLTHNTDISTFKYYYPNNQVGTQVIPRNISNNASLCMDNNYPDSECSDTDVICLEYCGICIDDIFKAFKETGDVVYVQNQITITDGCMDELVLEINETENNISIVQSLLDGGETEYLIIDVNNPTISQYGLVVELTEYEHLSEEVQKELIDKNDPLSSNSLKEILILQAPLSREVLEALKNRPIPVSTSAFNEILSAHYNSARESMSVLQNKLKDLRNSQALLEEKKALLYQLIDDVVSRDIVLQNSTHPSIQLSRTKLALKKGDWVEANNALADLETVSTEREWDKYESFSEVLQLMAVLGSEGRNIEEATEGEVAMLETIASNRYYGYLWAEILLHKRLGTRYIPELPNFTTSAKRAFVSDDEFAFNNWLEVYPIPANNFIVFKNKLVANAQISIYDSKGVLMHQSEISANEQYEVEVYDWTIGTYFYQIVSETGKVISNKISIIR